MFWEFKCGCIQGSAVGRVRLCERHKLDKKTVTGDGGAQACIDANMPGVIRRFPADGEWVNGWSGK